jgi:hypothetical protein
MKSHTEYPFQKSRMGLPATVFEKLGPYTMKVSNKGFYELYEVTVTGGVLILKQASRPSIDDIHNALAHACGSGEISYEVYDKYKTAYLNGDIEVSKPKKKSGRK